MYQLRLIKQPHNLCIVMHTSLHSVTWSVLMKRIPLICVAQVSAEYEQQHAVKFLILLSAECVCGAV